MPNYFDLSDTAEWIGFIDSPDERLHDPKEI